MDSRIVVDSCCDLTPELAARLGATSVPLMLTLGNQQFVDDASLDLSKFLEKMHACKDKIGSAAPSPQLFKEMYQPDCMSYVVTLSKNLSGTYNSALIGKSIAAEEGNSNVHVFDSKSASAAQVLIALKIRSLIEEGWQSSKIIDSVETFINDIKTYFILENIDNLMKNGRLNKVVGKLISVLNIKPLMCTDGQGNISLASHARGPAQVVQKLADTIEHSGKKTDGQSIVITHCNNPGLAQRLMDAIKARYQFKEIVVVPAGGVSTVYANDKGIVMAY